VAGRAVGTGVEHGQTLQLVVAESQVAVAPPAVRATTRAAHGAAHAATATTAHATLDLGDIFTGGCGVVPEQVKLRAERVDLGAALVSCHRATDFLVHAVGILGAIE